MTVEAHVRSPVTSLVVLNNSPLALTTPDQAADHFLGRFKEIEKLIEGSKGTIASIEGRSWYRSLFNSDSGDLVKVSRTQNAINDEMLLLIQEVVGLNSKGYAFLIEMVHGVDRRMRSGWVDMNGTVQSLSSSGITFAETACGIFLRIAEGVKQADERVAEAQAKIVKLDFLLSVMNDEFEDLRQHTDQDRAATQARMHQLDSTLLSMAGTIEDLRQQQIDQRREDAAACAGLARRQRALTAAVSVIAMTLVWVLARVL